MTDLEVSQIRNWYEKGEVSSLIQDNFCKTRFDFNGRLISYEKILKLSLPEACLYLASSSLGEIGNNCFDHNLGHWQSDPGCLFLREKNYCLIADRGRGVKNSLANVYKLSSEDKSYLAIAFEKVITGRAPEKRGNGLKFAKKNIINCNMSLYCASSEEEIFIGKESPPLFSKLIKPKMKNSGTLTLVTW